MLSVFWGSSGLLVSDKSSQPFQRRCFLFLALPPPPHPQFKVGAKIAAESDQTLSGQKFANSKSKQNTTLKSGGRGARVRHMRRCGHHSFTERPSVLERLRTFVPHLSDSGSFFVLSGTVHATTKQGHENDSCNTGATSVGFHTCSHCCQHHGHSKITLKNSSMYGTVS